MIALFGLFLVIITVFLLALVMAAWMGALDEQENNRN